MTSSNEPIRPFDRIVQVPSPTVLAEIAKTGCNAALGGYRVTACRKYLCNASCRQAYLDLAVRRDYEMKVGACCEPNAPQRIALSQGDTR